jgi:hypothetical protein
MAAKSCGDFVRKYTKEWQVAPTYQDVWDAAIRSVEALKPSHNSRYVATLEVISDFSAIGYRTNTVDYFRDWCAKRLNSTK